MNRKSQIDQLANEAMNSMDDAARAVPQPYLLTRINQRLHRSKESGWEKAGWFIGRPVVAIPGMALLILINVFAIMYTGADTINSIADQSAQVTPDEFSNTVATIYDNENP